ncbi:MAG: glycogen/starch synthase [Granulosicoccus sp.]
MSSKPHICMLAAENDAIPGAKVGGIGDVIRDLPRALAGEGATVSVIIPAYGAFHELAAARRLVEFPLHFRGHNEHVELYELNDSETDVPGVRTLVLHHASFAVCGKGHVYCDDTDGQPFATDASKFAMFSQASLCAIADGHIGDIDVLHLHDWHTGCAAILRAFDPAFKALQAIPCVFSIHNLALQGIRPLTDEASSLQAWFPDLDYDPADVSDPRWPHCVNPMVAGIRLADRVHTVSPAYALEIVQANDPERGFHGGEGLQADIERVANSGKLLGIINGIDYDKEPSPRLVWSDFMHEISQQILATMLAAKSIRSVDYVAHQRALEWQTSVRPKHILTSVGRLTSQKMSLLLGPMEDGKTALESILDSIADRGLFLMLGSGDLLLEQQCLALAQRYPNFLFINCYSQTLSELLFENGDLFIMPSSFEPCGISQMLAMRCGQPCLVHAVGGLVDTVQDNIDGFQFSGNTTADQSRDMLSRLQTVLSVREHQIDAYNTVAKAARMQRFHWSNSARRYLMELYQ